MFFWEAGNEPINANEECAVAPQQGWVKAALLEDRITGLGMTTPTPPHWAGHCFVSGLHPFHPGLSGLDYSPGGGFQRLLFKVKLELSVLRSLVACYMLSTRHVLCQDYSQELWEGTPHRLLLGPSPSGLHPADLRHLQEPWSRNNETISWGAAHAQRRGSW